MWTSENFSSFYVSSTNKFKGGSNKNLILKFEFTVNEVQIKQIEIIN